MTLETIVGYVGSLIAVVQDMFSAFATSTFWWMFLPITFAIFAFALGKVKSLLLFRKRRRR